LLRGGLYGSDAIAGVINFITKKNYQGAEFDASYDHPQGSGSRGPIQRFRYDQQRESDVSLPAIALRDLARSRLDRLSRAVALQSVLAGFHRSLDQRQYGE
jgi:outer membrane receptor protein involved in Fe transport